MKYYKILVGKILESTNLESKGDGNTALRSLREIGCEDRR
jgi:hypothetical protein